MGSRDKGGKAAGIRDIAEALGTAIGAVDRALQGRSGVSLRTKVQVLRMAEQLG
jgi:LacI family transcriptional regulator